MSRVIEQVGSITMYLKYGIVQCHKKSIKLRTEWQIWTLPLTFNGWVNELGQKAELYDVQRAIPIQYCLLWKLSITYKRIKPV